MSIFIKDIKDLFTDKLLEDVKKMISDRKTCKEKTEVDLSPQVNSGNDDDEDAPKKKKAPVSENIDVVFSDKEIEFFDKVFNTEGNQ